MKLTELLNNKKLQQDIKEGFELRIKVASSWANEVVIEYTESTCYLDKTGYTFHIETKGGHTVYPMRSADYIQAYVSFNRMIKSLLKHAESDLEIISTNRETQCAI